MEVHVASPLRSVHNREITTLCPSDSSRLEQRRRERFVIAAWLGYGVGSASGLRRLAWGGVEI